MKNVQLTYLFTRSGYSIYKYAKLKAAEICKMHTFIDTIPWNKSPGTQTRAFHIFIYVDVVKIKHFIKML